MSIHLAARQDCENVLHRSCSARRRGGGREGSLQPRALGCLGLELPRERGLRARLALELLLEGLLRSRARVALRGEQLALAEQLRLCHQEGHNEVRGPS